MAMRPERGGAGVVSGRLDRRSATEWLVVFGVGLAGVALAALAVLTPWQVGGLDVQRDATERIVRIHVPIPDVLSARQAELRRADRS
jgi:UDP-N-acetyl-D-mannosaminuronate dehydrogenase